MDSSERQLLGLEERLYRLKQKRLQEGVDMEFKAGQEKKEVEGFDDES